MFWHRHKWTTWKVVEAYHGEYVFGGGYARVYIQERHCTVCKKRQLDKQTA